MRRSWLPEYELTRREVLRTSAVVGSLLGAGAFTACTVRLDDAPAVTVTGIRAPVPDEAALLAAYALAERLAAGCAAAAAGRGTGAEGAATLAPLHAIQAGSLRDRLVRAGVPGSDVFGARARGAAVNSAGALAGLEAEARTPAALQVIASASATNQPVLGSLAVMHSCAADLLGRPDPAAPTPVIAQAALPEVYALRYALQVVVAQSASDGRTRATSVLGGLESLRATFETVAGAAAPTPAPAYPVTVRATSPAEAEALAKAVLAQAFSRAAAAVTAYAASPADLGAVIGWASTVARWGRVWSVPLTAFPGMALR